MRSHVVERLADRASAWSVIVDRSFETASSLIAFGKQGDRAVVLKVLKEPGDEWRAGEILQAFDGNGVVRVYEHAPGAMLLEELRPGAPLVRVALDRSDDQATELLADVIQRMYTAHLPPNYATVAKWGAAFTRYLESGDNQIPRALVERAGALYAERCSSQATTRLLHGDLQHYNVLWDEQRGWLAIDPKGVVGELEYEVGAAMRNPVERPDLFASRERVERRLDVLVRALNLNYERALSWTFAQAVLSAMWSVEDGFAVDATNSAIRLANLVAPILL
ncbi:MAG: aminoglycoside phosphotransferase family protein [Gemmatimonadaceae bacterium]